MPLFIKLSKLLGSLNFYFGNDIQPFVWSMGAAVV